MKHKKITELASLKKIFQNCPTQPTFVVQVVYKLFQLFNQFCDICVRLSQCGAQNFFSKSVPHHFRFLPKTPIFLVKNSKTIKNFFSKSVPQAPGSCQCIAPQAQCSSFFSKTVPNHEKYCNSCQNNQSLTHYHAQPHSHLFPLPSRLNFPEFCCLIFFYYLWSLKEN